MTARFHAGTATALAPNMKRALVIVVNCHQLKSIALLASAAASALAIANLLPISAYGMVGGAFH
jgi:hypothetical protein